MRTSFKFDLNDSLYLKDPLSSDLGTNLIERSIDLMDDIGYESFTFRKLAIEINSTEASIYRYFESKHKLLLYLYDWYWNWMEFKLEFAFANISSATERLDIAIRILTESVVVDGSFQHINEVKLNRIIISESSKCYLTRSVDKENLEGVFLAYKRLVQLVSDIILEINPEYDYPHMLVSTTVEGAHLQRYFALHLPRLTDTVSGRDAVTSFYTELTHRTILVGNTK